MAHHEAKRAAYGDAPNVAPFWNGWLPRLPFGNPGDYFLAEMDGNLRVTIDGQDCGVMAENCHEEMREALAAWGQPMRIVVRKTKASASNDAVQIPRPVGNF